MFAGSTDGGTDSGIDFEDDDIGLGIVIRNLGRHLGGAVGGGAAGAGFGDVRSIGLGQGACGSQKDGSNEFVDDLMESLLTSHASRANFSLPSSLNHADKREIGHEAVWTLSSAKPGSGVEQLRDNNLETFWQSDGIQPHMVNIQFHRKSRIKELSLYVDYKLDESYTPSKLSVRAGSGLHDLQEVQQLELVEPSGWVTIPLYTAVKVAHHQPESAEVLRAHLVQLVVLASHMNGRDTHIRQIKIFGPRQVATKGMNTDLSHFSSLEFEQFAHVR